MGRILSFAIIDVKIRQIDVRSIGFEVLYIMNKYYNLFVP